MYSQLEQNLISTVKSPYKLYKMSLYKARYSNVQCKLVRPSTLMKRFISRVSTRCPRALIMRGTSPPQYGRGSRARQECCCCAVTTPCGGAPPTISAASPPSPPSRGRRKPAAQQIRGRCGALSNRRTCDSSSLKHTQAGVS